MKSTYLAIIIVLLAFNAMGQYGLFKTEKEWRIAMDSSYKWFKLNNPNLPMERWKDNTLFEERLNHLMLQPVPNYFSAENLKNLYPLLKLKYVVINYTPEKISTVTAMPYLVSIRSTNNGGNQRTPIKGNYIDTFAKVPTLENLELNNWENLTDEDMERFAKIKRLRILSLKNIQNNMLTIKGISALGKCSNLDYLQLEFNDNLIRVDHLKEIQELLRSLPKMRFFVLPITLRNDPNFMGPLRKEFPLIAW